MSEPLHYVVPMLRDGLLDWTRALPDHYPLPELLANDICWLTTDASSVPPDVRERWEDKPPEKVRVTHERARNAQQDCPAP